MNTIATILIVSLTFVLSGCAAQTGIPGHGGGKRFAVEQELVAAATRSAIKQIDLSALKGRKVSLFVNAIGDTGAGNLIGGRFSVVSQLHGDYVQSPQVKETYVYPRVTSTSATTTSSGTTTTTQTGTGETVLAAPSAKTARQNGSGAMVQMGMEYKGLGAYHNSEEITSNDLQYLTALLQTYLYLQGVYVAPPSEAELDVYVTVDVFGTVHTRVEWFLANNEILRARTSLEVMAVDHSTGALVMPPQSACTESEYNEQYVLWAGPVQIRKSVKKAEPLLSDFGDLRTASSADRQEPVPYPFRHELEKRR
jgi:hypothetical protein